MSEENILVVQEAFKRFSEGDLTGFLDLCADDIEWDHRGP
ncbi:MAG TPA: ketosteroid isomerase, partial [Candidatus Latescibacteria bacterium]|nr:ketosteroid isomerase [Candidatus Latescibacterota bacterium]